MSESKKRKPVVGEKLVRWNPASRSSHERIDEVTVTKVGTKYFQVGDGWNHKFERDDWGISREHSGRNNWPAWLFESREELDQHKAELAERRRLDGWKNSYGNDKLTPDQVRRILAIIDEQGGRDE